MKTASNLTFGSTDSASNRSKCYDLLIIGGGINGAGIAADAAGRGLSVGLFEMADLASATSSASTKLIHGGLRYLENYEFGLVRKALAEREVLLRNAPHIIKPMRFQIPHQKHLRPRWMLRAGLFLYDNLSRRTRLAGSTSIRFGEQSPILPEFTHGFEYSDCFVDDSRLVVLNARLAQEKGAEIFVRTEVTKAQTKDGIWEVTVRDCDQDEYRVVRAKAVINAAGPWAGQIIGDAFPEVKVKPLRLVKGSHIIVPRIYNQDKAFLLQTEDGRVVFVIPYQKSFSLIGTTDKNYVGNPRDVDISADEKIYLIDTVNQYFNAKISSTDIISHYSGVRPLIDEEGETASKVSRDYELELTVKPAPILNVLGGKITTYRILAEDALKILRPLFPNMGDPWTSNTPLSGGDFTQPSELESTIQARFPWLPEDILSRWLQSYGTLIMDIIGDIESTEGLGKHFGHGLHEREVEYLVANEWAVEAEDILWRRTKLGLLFSEIQVTNLNNYLSSRNPITLDKETHHQKEVGSA